MPFLILSIQDGRNPKLPVVAPRGLHNDLKIAIRCAEEAQKARYSEFVSSIAIYKLETGAGWDPGDFQEDSPYVVYCAEHIPVNDSWKVIKAPVL